jgi:oxaloacetate decarboxylase alpha subunit
LGPLNALEAVKAGVQYIHTAIPPLANGASQPSIFNVAANLRALGYEASIDEAPLEEVSRRLHDVAKVEDLPVGLPLEYDERQYHHQIPGGMISNLVYQLDQLGMADRLDATLEETAQVRAELGYPIMVTPLSQFVATQAAINVITGARYQQVTDEIVQYALGRFGGTEATDHMDPGVRAKILDRPRSAALGHEPDDEPSLQEVRRRYAPGISDEELILRVFMGDEAQHVLDGAAVATADEPTPLLQLLRGLTDGSHRYVSIQKGELSLTLRRSEGSHGTQP